MDSREFIFRMHAIMRSIRPKQAISTAHSLTIQQMEILMHIAESGECVMGQVAKHLKITPSAATQSIQTLVKKNLLQRENKTNDRRQIVITLTEKAKRQKAVFQKEAFEHASKLLKKLTEPEQTTLKNLLQKMITEKTSSGKNK